MTIQRTFTIILEPAEEGGFIVTVPALPEVGTCGDTKAEALAVAREAIELAVEHGQASVSESPSRIARIANVAVTTPLAMFVARERNRT